MLDAAFQAIAEPRRRDILRLIRDRELSSGDIAAHFAVTRSAISQHLGVLAAAGLVTVRGLRTQRLYRLRPEGLAELRTFLEGFWVTGLAQLAAAAEAEESEAQSAGGGADHG